MAEEKRTRPARKKPDRIPRQEMPIRKPKDRIQDFEEVSLGFDATLAQKEAQRCLQCPKQPCMDGCPVAVDITGFIHLVTEGDFIGAAHKIKETNLLPAVCGRVCPQEEQCEQVCVVAKIDEPVAIGRLERFVADYEREQGAVELPKIAPPTGKKVAVIGSGPAGITVSYELLQAGHKVTIFEALHELGGVLVYGIPEFRLPKSIVAAEIDTIKQLGAEIKLNMLIGKTRTIDQLMDEDGFDAVFIGTGAGLPMFLNGNVAMDSARAAKRVGGDETEVSIIYRRGRDQMPAREEEIHHAEEEGIIFNLLTSPIRFIGDDNNHVKEVECVKMELGEPDDSGRRRPIAIKGSEHLVEADTVIVALGTMPRKFIAETTPDLKTSDWGTFLVEDETGETSKKGVFAGGDIVTGSATVIKAMGAGRVAAIAIKEYLVEN